MNEWAKRLKAPDNFDGDKTKWEDWHFKMKAYLSMQLPGRMKQLLTEAENATKQITDTDLIAFELDAQGDPVLQNGQQVVHTAMTEENRKMSETLHNILINMTTGTALQTVKGNKDGNGFETWRKLYEKFTTNVRLKAMQELMKILRTTFDDRNFLEDFEKWENRIKEYETASNEELTEKMKITTLVAGTKGKLGE